MFSGSQIVTFESPIQLQILLCLESLSFFATLLSGFTKSRAARSHGPIYFDWGGSVGFSPFRAATIIRVTISELTGLNLQSFAPSSQTASSVGPYTFGFWIRKVNFILLSHLVIFSVHLAGGYVGLRTTMTNSTDENLIRCLFSQAGYPALLFLWSKHTLQSGMLIPSMVSPRSIWPSREDLLVRDPASKVAYPSKEAINPERTESSHLLAKAMLCYHCVVVASVWWMG